jgi:hypothetical protein
MNYFVRESDGWILNKLGGKELGKSLFDVKRETLRSETIFRVAFTPLYKSFI